MARGAMRRAQQRLLKEAGESVVENVTKNTTKAMKSATLFTDANKKALMSAGNLFKDNLVDNMGGIARKSFKYGAAGAFTGGVMSVATGGSFEDGVFSGATNGAIVGAGRYGLRAGLGGRDGFRKNPRGMQKQAGKYTTGSIYNMSKNFNTNSTAGGPSVTKSLNNLAKDSGTVIKNMFGGQ